MVPGASRNKKKALGIVARLLEDRRKGLEDGGRLQEDITISETYRRSILWVA